MTATERKLNIIKFLFSSRYATMKNIAEQFNVSVRTVQRDIDEISLFVPIYVKNGRYDGGVYVLNSAPDIFGTLNKTEKHLLKKAVAIASEKLDENENIILADLIKSI